MSKDVTLLQLYHRAVEKVKVTAADGAASNLEDDIAVLDDLWFGAFD